MPQLRPQAIDGLWQCFCPSFDQNVLRRSSLSPRHSSFTRSQCSTQRITLPRNSRRTIVTIIPSHPKVPNFWKAKHIGEPVGRNEKAVAPSLAPRDTLQSLDQPDEHQVRVDRILLDSSSNDIRKLPNSRIHAILRSEANRSYLIRVREVVEILVRERGEIPDKRHYHALISAQANAEHGSAAEVERLLEEMHKIDIELDAGICRAVLKALAVHPHYMLRCYIMKEMERSWFPLDRDGHQHIAAGLLRDLQFELAWERLNKMQAQGFNPEPWLLSLFMYALSSIECFPEVHTLLKSIIPGSDAPIPAALWSHLLHTATREQYQPLVRDIWNHAVKNSYINPSSGLCTMILESCAAHGDMNLAADVFQVLSERSSPLELWHYESLLEAYIIAGDLDGMLSTLQIMVKAGCPLTHASMRSMFTCLRQSEDMVADVLGLISRASNSGKPVPLTFINVVLEAMTHQGNLSAAMDIVRELERLTPEPATCETFNVLLQGCTLASRKDLAMSLALEMRQKGITPSALTYDRLILVCLSTGLPKDFQDAWKYYEEFISAVPPDATGDKRWALRRGTVRNMITKCLEFGDKRAFGLLERCLSEGMRVTDLRDNLNKEWERKWNASPLSGTLENHSSTGL